LSIYVIFIAESVSILLAGIGFVLGDSRVKKYKAKMGIHIRNAPKRVEGKKDDGGICETPLFFLNTAHI